MQSQKVFATWGRVCLLLLLAVAITPVLARAQQSVTGEIKGSVSDASGAVVPGVAVSIDNVATGFVTPSTTNDHGLYDVPFLTPGNYTLTFSKQGFRDFVRQGVSLAIETLEVDATLQVGTATQEVVVNAEPSLVETDTTEQHVDLNAAAVTAAPIIGTDWRNALVELSPGVNTGGGSGAANGQGVGINGTQSYNIGFTIDGSNATSPRDFNGSNNIVPVDTIAEVNINSANAGPEYGNALSAFNAVTKSGTNTWHGSGFLYDQNTDFNARPYTNVTGAKSKTHYNLFGGTVGGPIIKNKLFFFFAYQYNPSTSPVSGTYSYPTTAMEAGNFTGQPLTNLVGCSGCTTTMIPTADFSTVAKNLQAYFPAAGAAGWVAGCPGTSTCPTSNNFLYNNSDKGTNTWYEGKLDYNFSSKQKVSFSLNYYPEFTTNIAPDPLYPSLASAISTANNYNLTAQLTYTYTISPTELNEFRAGVEREYDAYLPYSWNKGSPAQLGLEPAYGSNAPYNQFPQVVVEAGSGDGNYNLGTEGASNVGSGGVNGNGNINAILGQGTYTFSDILTLIRGRHTIKVGGEFDKFYQNYNNWGASESGSFGFNGNVTGNPYGDFLLGDVDQWFVTSDPQASEHNWTSGLFVGDDFKVSSHVTLNLGLRWQIQSGWGVSFNEFGTYDPYLPNSQAYTCNQTALTCSLNSSAMGAVLLGASGDTATGGTTPFLNKIQNTDYKEFAPRLGIAWSPSPNWVIRTSYGIFIAPRDAENYTDGATAPFFSGDFLTGTAPAAGNPGTPTFKLDVGPPAGTFAIATLASLNPQVLNFGGTEYYPRNEPTNHVSEFMLDIQHQFNGGVMIDAGYVYTRGSNLNFQTDTDQAPLSKFTTSCPAINESINGVMRNVNADCVGPVPQYTSIVSETYDGWSNYNALQIRAQKRAAYGFSFLANYSWSKSLDTGTGGGHGSGINSYQNAYSPIANYALSSFNATDTLTGQIVWELPFGSGRQFVLHGVMDEVVGGWRVSSLFQWHSGIPFTPTVSGGTADALDPGLINSFGAGVPNNGAGSALYPNVISTAAISSHSNIGIGTQWFNAGAFAAPASGAFGDSARDSLMGPHFGDVDFSVAKDFPLHWREGMSLQIRADITNVFNHPNFSNPDSTLGDSSFGKITGVTGGPRDVQLGAHFTF